MSKEDKHISRCTECSKSLMTECGKYVQMYMPQSQGPTLLRPLGSQCSNECYTKACDIRRHEVSNTIRTNRK